jgi:hypothetical protein
MKNPLWALALAAGMTSLAQAQPGIDAGLAEPGVASLAIGKRNLNLLGFKGVDELGSGLKALFRHETVDDDAMLDGGLRPALGLHGVASLRIRRASVSAIESLSAFASLHGAPQPLAGAGQPATAANRQ